MAWISIPNNTEYEFDNNPPDPGGAQTPLWLKQVQGVRTVGVTSPIEIYTRVRKVGSSVDDAGELNKTYWDNV